MSELLIATVLFAVPQDFGSAPKNTLNPEEAVKRLGEIFHNCSFTGEQKRESENRTGTTYSTKWDVVGKGCEDAVIVQYKMITDHTNSKGGRVQDRVENRELRWLKNDKWMHLDLLIKDPNHWPIQPTTTAVKVDKAAVYPTSLRDRKLAWEEILVSDFAGEVDKLGLAFADMVAEGGRFGYKFEKAVWSSADRAQIAYHLTSPEYGTTVITFAKQPDREWAPIVIHLIRSRNHKIAPNDWEGRDNQLLAPNNRVGNFREFSDFSEPALGLDRLDQLFEIDYATKATRSVPLPISLKRTDTRFFKSERSVIQTLLTFKDLKIGNVSCDEVLKAMQQIPNGTKVYVLEPEYKNIEMVWMDGKPVKWIDSQALFLGRSAKFSTWTRFNLLLFAACLALIVGIRLYMRSRASKVNN